MQDRFKFRVWKGQENRMVYDVTYLNPLILDPAIKNENKHNISMQCTGLKDKNGRLIYEGDILKGKKNMICSPHSSKLIDKVGVVEIPQNMFVATCRDVKNNCTLFCQNDWVKTEVIGNIYQDKELLNDSN